MAKLTSETLGETQKEYAAQRQAGNWIKVGLSTCGIAAGAEPVYAVLQDEVKKRGLDIEVKRTGCIGTCYAEPNVEVNIEGSPRTMYGNVDPEGALRILDEHVTGKGALANLALAGIETLGFVQDGDIEKGESKQVRIVARNCGVIDPNNIEDYIARDGYKGLARALELGPKGVIEELKVSGLRGRGGAGYPTWLKWSFLQKAPGDEKYMICNGDEGDPGAYMDRSILESDPHSVIEGMAIAAYTVGAKMGYFYIRAEYPLAIERIETAIRQAKRNGLLGKKVLGSDFEFDLDIRLGAGAFVCGEETALMASIEGRRGTPWPRPPFPAQKGLWGKPSNINNVETLANIAPILVNGGKWFASYGTDKSKGTKVFAVTGNVAKSGLVEIPMGTTLREVVFDICGGVPGGNKIKAIQTGGPSGGVIPERYFDTPISYETLHDLGSIMGSGGMIVMDETDSMVDIAKFYIGFSVDESCGKCAPCRIGGKQLHLLLDKVQKGEGTSADLAAMRRICEAMQKASLCGLGQTAPNPVLSTMKYFENEYRELIKA